MKSSGMPNTAGASAAAAMPDHAASNAAVASRVIKDRAHCGPAPAVLRWCMRLPPRVLPFRTACWERFWERLAERASTRSAAHHACDRPGQGLACNAEVADQAGDDVIP